MECLRWTLVKFTACVAFETFGLVVFVALGVFVAFMGHWSWTLVAFSAVFMGCWGLDVCSILQFLWHLCGLVLYIQHLCGV